VPYEGVEPHDAGMLDVGDGQRLYWEVCGDPDGKPAVVLHGGPGSGCGPLYRRFFDPSRYRAVLFDQRGCGRSTPSAADPDTDLSVNTTQHLLRDIEVLREHLSIERWLVFGLSWGSTLALAYAQQHPEGVSELIVGLVVTTSRREVTWITRDVGRLIPEQWERFRDHVPVGERDGDLAAAYARLLEDGDPAVRSAAADAWCVWEDAHVSILDEPPPPIDDPRERMTYARLVTHYWRHAGFLEDGELLREMDALAGTPGVLVHGRADISSPLDVPWQLHRRWPGSELVVVDGGGHSGRHGMFEALTAVTDRFAVRD
jgi:proline iminopeptidase